MARIRSIKPEFWTSEQVMSCCPLSRLMFIGMWNFADDMGRMPISYKSIKAQIFPGDEDIKLERVRGMIHELSENGLILIYDVDGKEYLKITGWSHQRIDKPQHSKYPGPIVDDSKNVLGTLPPDRKGEDKKGEEGKGDARDALQKRVGDFRQAIVQAYAEANSPSLPDTSRAELWITQGYQEDICLAVIAGIVRKKPNAGLSYFDSPIAEAHAKKAPPRKAVGPAPPMDWDAVLTSYKKFGHWSRDAGNDPTSPNCRAPPEILKKYGFEPVGTN